MCLNGQENVLAHERMSKQIGMKHTALCSKYTIHFILTYIYIYKERKKEKKYHRNIGLCAQSTNFLLVCLLTAALPHSIFARFHSYTNERR